MPEPVPTNERLRELACEADSTIATMQEDCADFISKGYTPAAGHYNRVIQKQIDIAAACRALIAVREYLDKMRADAQGDLEYGDPGISVRQATLLYVGEIETILGPQGGGDDKA